MAFSGINKPACKAICCEVRCFMSDPDFAEKEKRGVTRAVGKYGTLPQSGDSFRRLASCPEALCFFRFYNLFYGFNKPFVLFVKTYRYTEKAFTEPVEI